MAVYVSVAGKDIELNYPLIDGVLNLMAMKYGNNFNQETIRRAEELKKMVAGKSKDESQGIKPRIEVTVPKKPRSNGNPKRKIRKLDQPASTSGAKPGPSSRAFGIQTSTSQVEPGPSSREFGIQPSTSRVELGPSSRASYQPASMSRARPRPSLPAGIQHLIGLCSMPIQKQITPSDVSHGQCRLMLPKSPTEELLKHIQLNPNEDIKLGIQVTVYGPDGREYAMNFKIWPSKTYYVLNTRSWNQFCQDYGLRSFINMATLTIWMFRHRQTDDLCFAITL